MPIARKTRLAVAALLELAQEPGHQPLPMISARLRVSVSYLELLFSRLRRGGLVRSTRGPGGGYCLARAPEQITVQDVVAAVHAGDEPTRDGAKQGKQPGGARIDVCWDEFEQSALRFLSSISLCDIIDAHRRGARLAAAAA